MRRSNQDLTDAPMIVAAVLNKTCGRENALTNTDLILALAARSGIKVSGETMRAIIHEIRLEGLCVGLCAGREGYWVSCDHEEVADYAASLEARANSIMLVSQALKKQAQAMRSRSIQDEANRPRQLSLFGD